MTQILRILTLSETMFIVMKETSDTTSNIGCFSKAYRRSQNSQTFNEWVYNNVKEFKFTLLDFDDIELLNTLLKQEYFEY